MGSALANQLTQPTKQHALPSPASLLALASTSPTVGHKGPARCAIQCEWTASCDFPSMGDNMTRAFRDVVGCFPTVDLDAVDSMPSGNIIPPW